MRPAPSRYPAKVAPPPTRDELPEPTARLPETTPPDAPAPSTSPAPDDWTGRTAEFLAAAPEPAAAEPMLPGTLPDLSIDFRHSCWAANRRRVDAALQQAKGVSQRRIAAFRCCGANATVEMSDPKQYQGNDLAGAVARSIKNAHPEFRVRSIKCHDRFCVPCSNEKSNRIRHAILDYIHDLPDLSLITFTLLHSDRPLGETLDRMNNAFRAIRAKPLWKKAVAGGVFIVETKIGAGSGKWNLHLHIVAQAKFMPQKALSDMWFKITGDSIIVDIRRVGARTGAVQYITKYITKAADNSITSDPAKLQEAIEAFTGRRLVSTFGTWRGLKLMEVVDEYEHEADGPTTWRVVGSLDEIIKQARAGEPLAARILRAISPRKFESSA